MNKVRELTYKKMDGEEVTMKGHYMVESVDEKQKAIEDLAKTLYAPELERQNNGYGELCSCRRWYEEEPCKEKYKCDYYISIAKHLYNAGYGNIEKALTEFAEWLKAKWNIDWNHNVTVTSAGDVDEKLKEFLGK